MWNTARLQAHTITLPGNDNPAPGWRRLYSTVMSAGNVARLVVVLAAAVAAIGSAASNQQNQPVATSPYTNTNYSPPPPQEMEAARALGLWRSTFGAVKIEADDSRGGLDAGAIQGIWVYERHGQEVVGYFSGSLRGNVLSFKWQEPANPPLTGEGYIVFDRTGKQYSGRWWSDRRDRTGEWHGSRNTANAPNPYDRRERRDDRRDYDRDRSYDGGQDDSGGEPYNEPAPAPAPPPRRRAPAPQPGGYGPQPQPTYY